MMIKHRDHFSLNKVKRNELAFKMSFEKYFFLLQRVFGNHFGIWYMI